LFLSIARAGSTVNLAVAPALYEISHSLSFCFWVGAAFLDLSMVLSIGTILISQLVEMTAQYSQQKALARRTKLSDLKHFNSRFWLVMISNLGCYLSFLPFLNISTAFAIDKFHLDNNTAGILSVLYFIT
jgi:nitrate/nitrite transporter NarK